MSTDHMYYPGQALTLGMDGMVPTAPPLRDDCCAYGLCMSDVEAACSILDLLPTGPMWDAEKLKVRQQLVDYYDLPIEMRPAGMFDCPSMVTYAVYLGLVLKDMVDSTIGVSVREHQPHTATDLDAALARLDWRDCYRTACRDNYIAQLSPYETPTECGTEYCPAAFPEDFENAMKHAIIQSLTRAQRGFINNLNGLNWVIAPLGAQLLPGPYPATVEDCLDGPAPCTECFCGEVALSICNVGETLPGAPTWESFCGEPPAPVAAQQSYTCEGNTVMLYPGVIAAECIVRAYMPNNCPNIVYRCEGLVVIPNRPPVDGNETVSVTENVPVSRTAETGLLANASDPDDGAVLTVASFSIAGQPGPFTLGTPYNIPNVGSLTIEADGSFDFTPATNYSGAVPVVSYVVTDQHGATNNSTLTFNMVNVPSPPEAAPYAVQVTEDVTIVRTEANGLLSDAIDNDGPRSLRVQSFNVVGQPGPFTIGTPYVIPGVGTLTIELTGAYTFQPVANYNGAVPLVNFTIVDTGNGLTDSATLTLTMQPVNDPPVDGNESRTVQESTTLTVSAAQGLLANATDFENDTLTVFGYTIAGIAGQRTVGTPYVIAGIGTITIFANGAFTFVPVAGYDNAVPVITYTVTDGTSTDTSTLTLNIQPSNTAPTANNDTGTTQMNQQLIGNVLANDTDTDYDDTLVITGYSANGVNATPGQVINMPGIGTISIVTDGTYNFQPATNYMGDVPVISYSMSDGMGGVSSATLTLTVTPINTPPFANNNVYGTTQGVTLTRTAANGLLLNDGDFDGDPIHVTHYVITGIPGDRAVGVPYAWAGIGTLTINADGSLTYVPDPAFIGNTPSLRYYIADIHGGTNDSTLVMQVTA